MRFDDLLALHVHARWSGRNGVGRKAEIEEQARTCFAALSDFMVGGPQPEAYEEEAIDVVGAIEALCLADPGIVRVWCKSLLDGLLQQPDALLSADGWVAHCEWRVNVLGWPRVLKMLITLTDRAEKAREAATGEAIEL